MERVQVPTQWNPHFERWTMGSAMCTFLLVLVILLPDFPGVYRDGRLQYLSDNLAFKDGLGILLIASTTPVWLVLSLTVKDLTYSYERVLFLNVLALPITAGTGVVLFPLTQGDGTLHYFWTGIFVGSISLVHPIATITAKHCSSQRLAVLYWTLVICGILCAITFASLALLARNALFAFGDRQTLNSIAAAFEFACIIIFILLNASAGARVREHFIINS